MAAGGDHRRRDAGAGGAARRRPPAGSEKTVSYVRKEFRATAESRKRPPLIAEAMVDPDVAIRGVIEKGKLLTLTTDEALKHKVAELRADSLEAALERLGIRDAELRRAAPNWAENVVRFLTHPVLSSLLVTIGMLGIIIELRTPGFGIAGAIGVGSLGAVLLGPLAGAARRLGGDLLALVGVALLRLELFVIPGFGFAGILGIVALVAALVMSVAGSGATPEFLMLSAGRIVLALLAALLASFLLLRFMPRTPFGRRLILQDRPRHGTPVRIGARKRPALARQARAHDLAAATGGLRRHRRRARGRRIRRRADRARHTGGGRPRGWQSHRSAAHNQHQLKELAWTH